MQNVTSEIISSEQSEEISDIDQDEVDMIVTVCKLLVIIIFSLL